MLDELAHQFTAAPGTEQEGFTRVEGVDIAFRFSRSMVDEAPLVVRFHGAINRTKRPIPAFAANSPTLVQEAHQISISDPTMVARDGFSCSWYIGHYGAQVQVVLGAFIRAVQVYLKASRIIYLGGSGGGFAALYFSYTDPDSVAVAVAPQTSLTRHNSQTAVDRYLANCWPTLALDQVSEYATHDLIDLYSGGFTNTVIYMQSQGDFAHSRLHMLPFLDACARNGESAFNNLLLHSGYWGRRGHSGAIPAQAYLSWVRAAVAAVSTQPEDILDALNLKEAPPRGRDESPNTSASSADIALGDLITNGLLRSAHNTEGSNNHG